MKGRVVRLTKHITSLPAFSFTITYFTGWIERRRRRKAIEMRLTTLLALVLKFPVTTALVYGQEVHYNYERGANFSAYKTYQWVDTPAAAPKSDPASAPKANTGVPPNLPALPNLPAPPPILLGGAPNFPGGAS